MSISELYRKNDEENELRGAEGYEFSIDRSIPLACKFEIEEEPAPEGGYGLCGHEIRHKQARDYFKGVLVEGPSLNEVYGYEVKPDEAYDVMADPDHYLKTGPELDRYLAALNQHFDGELREPKHNAQVEGAVSPELASEIDPGNSIYSRWPIQPGYFSETNELPFLDGSVVKRVLASLAFHEDDDYEEAELEIDKAIHELQLIKQWRFSQ